jgi:deazaflavin-dependent oxidoreductase (nitroreductase family)
MGLRDSFSMRQRPRGLFKWLLRLPNHLYRARLGWLLGDRFLLITHRGRRSGQLHRTTVEVVEHDRSGGEYVVCSGTGPNADWYRNLHAAPAEAVQVGTRQWRPDQRFLTAAEAADRFADYEREHPRTAVRLLRTMGNSYDGTDEGRVAMMADMPMVAFSDQPARAGDAAPGPDVER